MTRIEQVSTGAIDAIRMWLVDAARWVPSRWCQDHRPRINAGSDAPSGSPFVVTLDASDCLEITLPPLGEDEQDVDKAFRLQAAQLSPIPLSEIAYGFSCAPDRAWQAVVVRQSTLDVVREQVGSHAGRLLAFEYVSRDGQATAILDARARASRRRRFVLSAGLVAIFLALSALLVTALESRSRSDLDLRLAHQTTLTAQLRDLVAQRAQLQAQTQARGQSLTSLAELYTFLAETRPIGWHVEQIELDAAGASAVFSMDPSRESESGRLMERWREFFDGREIVLNRTVNRSGDIVLTLSARSEQA